MDGEVNMTGNDRSPAVICSAAAFQQLNSGWIMLKQTRYNTATFPCPVYYNSYISMPC